MMAPGRGRPGDGSAEGSLAEGALVTGRLFTILTCRYPAASDILPNTTSAGNRSTHATKKVYWYMSVIHACIFRIVSMP